MVARGDGFMDFKDSMWYVMNMVNEFIEYLNAHEGERIEADIMRRIKDREPYTEEEIDLVNEIENAQYEASGDPLPF